MIWGGGSWTTGPAGNPPAGGSQQPPTHNGAGEASLSRESSQPRGTVLPWEAGGTGIPLQGQG